MKKLIAIAVVCCICFITACSINNEKLPPYIKDKSSSSMTNSSNNFAGSLGGDSYSEGASSSEENSKTQGYGSISDSFSDSLSTENSNTCQSDISQSADRTDSSDSVSSVNSYNSSVNSNSSNSTSSVNSSNSLSSSSSSSNSSSSTAGDEENILDSDSSQPQKPKLYDLTLQNATFSGQSVASTPALFNVEGYGKNVTGGGIMGEGDSGYVKVYTADQFIKAISRKNYDDKNDTTFRSRPMVIEVMNDLDLGYNMLSSETQAYSDIVEANRAQYHPTLKKTGVSTVYITARENLTIFSKNGAKIEHACFQIRGDGENGSKNIMIRNLRFCGAWEWDDSGKYDDNDWDIFTLRADKGNVSDIWIDHCTFTKPYDGTIDIKYHATDITISWCAFLPYENTDSDFMDMMNYLESNRSQFSNYNQARNGGASFADMVEYASINKKVHLIGHSDNNAGDENIRVTFCNNYYYNCTERLPRLRMGKAHVYNCIFNAERANNFEDYVKQKGINWPSALVFNSNGSLGTNYGKLLLENCYIDGINTPLRNNNKNDGEMYVGSCEALFTYYTATNIDRSAKYGLGPVKYSGRYTFLGNSTQDDGNLVTPFPSKVLPFDTDLFKSQLGYGYVLYDPTCLYLAQNGNVGADKMNFDPSLWLRSSYKEGDKISNTIKTQGVSGLSANLGAGRL